MVITKGLMLQAKNNPNHLAIMDGYYRYSYSELAGRTAKLKAALKNRGIQKGDRVGLLMLNSFRFLELLYAITAIGAIAVPLNTRLSLAELVFILQDAEIKMLFIHPEFLGHVPLFKEKAAFVHEYILVEDEVTESTYPLYEQLVEGEIASNLTYDDVHEDDVAFIFYTGGTTGRSKGVMLSHRNILSNYYQMCVPNKVHEVKTYLHAAPMFHLADCSRCIEVTWGGKTHSFIRTFTPKGFLQAVQDYRVSDILLIPTMLNMALNEADFEKYDMSCLERIFYGGSPMPLELIKKAVKALPNVEFFQAYAMTEMSLVLTSLGPKDHDIDGDKQQERRLTSVGKNVPGVEVRVVDADGNDVKAEQIGEIIARGPTMMKGYWKLPEETAAAIRDGWYYTGDMAMIDEDHYVYIVDRKIDMIISGGENIYSVEVENVIYSHPEVIEAAVIGVPHVKWGEAVKAFVVKRLGSQLTEQELIGFTRKSLANFKVPKSVEFIKELPKSGAGKIVKRVLREEFMKDSWNSSNFKKT